jgi:hypothetical protein
MYVPPCVPVEITRSCGSGGLPQVSVTTIVALEQRRSRREERVL